MSKTDQHLIYRITHVDNVPWILEHGLHASSSGVCDPNFVRIGNADLISKRATRRVPIEPGGLLEDYVPFYFGTHSAMLYQIHTGQVPGVTVPQRDIVHVVSSVEKLVETGARFVFTNRHAYVVTAKFFDDIEELDELDWILIRSRDFRRDPDRPEKAELRMAEMLVHQAIACEGLLGIACYHESICTRLRPMIKDRGLTLPVAARPAWYF